MLLFPSSRAPYTPRYRSDLHIWHDASQTGTISDTSGSVDSISDPRGGETLSQTGTLRPITNSRTVNGLNVLDLDGSDDYLQGTVTGLGSGSPAVHLFAVCQMDSGGLGSPSDYIGAYWDTSGAQSQKILSLRIEDSGFTQTEPSMSTFQTPDLESNITGSVGNTLLISYSRALNTNSTAASFRVHGTDATETGGNASNLSFDNATPTMQIGAAGGAFNYFDGMFCEWLWFDAVLSAADTELIEGYLAHKWGTVAALASGHTYKAVRP